MLQVGRNVHDKEMRFVYPLPILDNFPLSWQVKAWDFAVSQPRSPQSTTMLPIALQELLQPSTGSLVGDETIKYVQSQHVLS